MPVRLGCTLARCDGFSTSGSSRRAIKQYRPEQIGKLQHPSLKIPGGLARQSGPGRRGGEPGISRVEVPRVSKGSTGSLSQDGGPDRANVSPRGAAEFLGALYRFSRPHTMLGTFVSVVSVSLLALQGSPVTGAVLQGLMTALVPALLMNICIVGLNQLYDVEIDKVNKPQLPLASGELGMASGVRIVASTGAVALLLGSLSGSVPLMWTLAGSLALGVVYSADVPFLRWKQYPVLAASCVLCVRAVLVQLGFYLHMMPFGAAGAAMSSDGGSGAAAALAVAGEALKSGSPLGFTMTFMLLFSIVIALFKDIPDTKGDLKAQVRTLSVRLGVDRVFWICIAILEAAYLGAMGYGATQHALWVKAVVVAGHAVMAALLWRKAKATDLRSNSSITECYMFVWKLFYAEYLLIPLLR